MSATFRHDIGVQIAAAIRTVDHHKCLDALGARDVSRYAGVYRDRWKCVTFALKLPSQVGVGYRLLRVVGALQAAYTGARYDASLRRSTDILGPKLLVSLGLPTAADVGPEELGFLRSIDATPDDIAIWSGYADWLCERDCPRGDVITAWLAKSAMETKYGVPVKSRDVYKSVPKRDVLGEILGVV